MGNTKQSTDSSQQSQTSGTQNTDFSQQATPSSWLDTLLNTGTPGAAQSYGNMAGIQTNATNLVNNLLTGQNPGGAYNGIYGGVTPEQQDAIVQQSLRDVPMSLQLTGNEDSGVGQALYARGAQNVRSNVAQFNVQNLSNILSQALSGQYSAQAPQIASQGNLFGALQGLNSITGNQNGTFSQQGNFSGNSTTTHNPFLESFYSSLGGSLGKSAGSISSVNVGPLGKFGGA